MLPAWRENPYQQLLSSGLESRGLEVQHAGWRRMLRPWRIRADAIDVVHLHSIARFLRTRFAAVAAARALGVLASALFLRASGVRLVVTVHDLHDHDRLHPALEFRFGQMLLRVCHQVVTHGEVARRLVRKRFRVKDPERISVIPHGPFDQIPRRNPSREEARAELGVEAEPFVFLFLGSIREYKGVEELVAAYAEVAGPETRLWIRGRARSASLAGRIERAAAGVPGVDFRDAFVEDEDLEALLAACDVVVAPYLSILTSGSIALAQSHGRACVAPAMGGIPDVLDDASGILYEPWESEGLTGALRSALLARSELSAMGEHALASVTRVGWTEIAAQTHAVYRR